MLAPVKAEKKNASILSTDPGAPTFKQWIALALLWFSAGFRNEAIAYRQYWQAWFYQYTGRYRLFLLFIT